MANTNQIFAPQVYAQAPKINPAIFAQAVPSFKPLDLTTILEAEKMEYLKQKMAIDAQKNMIDLEEAKARLKIAENSVKEKRVNDNKAYLNMLMKSMDITGEKSKDPFISTPLREKYQYYDKKWYDIAANVGNSAAIDQDMIKGAAFSVMTEQSNDKDFIKLQRLDSFMRDIVKESQYKDSPLDRHLVEQSVRAYQDGLITDQSQVNTPSMEINTKYMDKKAKDVQDMVNKMYTENVQVKEGNTYKTITTIRSGATPEAVFGQAYTTLTGDRDYMRFLENTARRDQIINKNLSTEVPDIPTYMNELVQKDAWDIARTSAPAIGWDKMTNPIRKDVDIKMNPAVGGAGTNNTTLIYSELDPTLTLGKYDKQGYSDEAERQKKRRDGELVPIIVSRGVDLKNNPDMRAALANTLDGLSTEKLPKFKVSEDRSADGYGIYMENDGKKQLYFNDKSNKTLTNIQGKLGEISSTSDKLNVLQRLDQGYGKLVNEPTKSGRYLKYQIRDDVWNEIRATKKSDAETINAFDNKVRSTNSPYVKNEHYFTLNVYDKPKKRSTSSPKPQSNITPTQKKTSKITPPTTKIR